MDKITKVYLFRADGSPLMADVQPMYREPYQRTLAGFLPAAERDDVHEYIRWSRVERPPHEHVHEYEDAEGVQLEIQEEEAEEDC